MLLHMTQSIQCVLQFIQCAVGRWSAIGGGTICSYSVCDSGAPMHQCSHIRVRHLLPWITAANVTTIYASVLQQVVHHCSTLLLHVTELWHCSLPLIFIFKNFVFLINQWFVTEMSIVRTAVLLSSDGKVVIHMCNNIYVYWLCLNFFVVFIVIEVNIRLPH